jgi:hypothetical protein
MALVSFSWTAVIRLLLASTSAVSLSDSNSVDSFGCITGTGIAANKKPYFAVDSFDVTAIPATKRLKHCCPYFTVDGKQHFFKREMIFF